MTGREFVVALETQGFVVKRRSSSFVWMGRDDQTLMVDLDSMIPDGFLDKILGSSRRSSHAPASGGRRSRPSSLSLLARPPRAIPKA